MKDTESMARRIHDIEYSKVILGMELRHTKDVRNALIFVLLSGAALVAALVGIVRHNVVRADEAEAVLVVKTARLATCEEHASATQEELRATQASLAVQTYTLKLWTIAATVPTKMEAE